MKYKTSYDAGHLHYWEKSKKYTTVNGGHKHKIDMKKKLAVAIRPGLHTHKLLNVEVKNK